MSHNSSYFMRDQAHHRVRRLMRGRLLASDLAQLATPYRPVLLVALGVLTAINIMLVVP